MCVFMTQIIATLYIAYIISATECRTFLLPLLCGILPDMYLTHALLLSKAIRILLCDRLTPADIEVAENMLNLFWRLTEKFYGIYVVYLDSGST